MKYLILTMVLVLMTACSATFQPTGSCVDGDSVILSVTNGNPSGLDKALLTVNFVGLEAKDYTADQVTEFLDVIEAVVKDGVGYADLVSFIDSEVERVRKYAGATMIVLGSDIRAIARAGGPVLISDCDRELILAAINNQRAIVALYAGMSFRERLKYRLAVNRAIFEVVYETEIAALYK